VAERLRLIVPELGADELAEVKHVLDSGFLTQGPTVEAFEAGIAQVTGATHAIATTSATTALHVTLAALGVGPGDEVIVSDFTFPATSNVVLQQGATPVLVDIDLATFNTTADRVAAAVTPRTRAFIPVHAFGLAAPMSELMGVAHDAGIAVVEDAACALGATRDGTYAGRFGTAGCFSFHPRKAITTGEGGMVVTDDATLASSVRSLRTHGGRRVAGRYTFEDVGFNYRLSDVQAAIGLAQLRRLTQIIEGRRRIAALYDARLASVVGVTTPLADPGHVYQSYVVLLDEAIDRDGVIAAMAADGIETTLGTYAVHAQPAIERRLGYSAGDLPNSWRAFRSSLTLPLYGRMTEGDVERVASSLSAAISAR
jgi:perosamine synthetase